MRPDPRLYRRERGLLFELKGPRRPAGGRRWHRPASAGWNVGGGPSYVTGRGGHPIDLCRYQVLNCYTGRVPLINSGGESKGQGDLADAVRTAVINKRAGGTGLISGRKAFQRPMKEGIALLNAIQDVYRDTSITLA